MKKEKTTGCPNCETDKFLLSRHLLTMNLNCGKLDENEIILTKQKG
jgi:hypothetical protein